MQIKALGNWVLVEKIRPASELLDGVPINESSEDNIFIFRVLDVGTGRQLDNGSIIPIKVKAGDEVMIAGKIIPVPGLIYGGRDNYRIANAEQIVGIVEDRKDWDRPRLLVASAAGYNLTGKERQMMHAGAAKAERVS